MNEADFRIESEDPYCSILVYCPVNGCGWYTHGIEFTLGDLQHAVSIHYYMEHAE